MSGGVFKIMTIGGIAIKVHWSWVIILALVTFQLAVGYFPLQMPGENTVVYWGLGLIAALLLFVSVLLHELSHSFMALARGLKVRDIVLFIFGGVSNIEQEPESARDEFLVTVVGPLSSLVLAAIFFGLEQLVSPPVRRVGAGAAAVLQYLAFINLLLGLFNLIPGFPLDGGRVLRSIVWAITRNLQTATRVAGAIGQLVAYGFIFWGLYQAFFLSDLSGLWISFIGWYLLNAAQQSVAGTVVRESLRGMNVGQVMEPAPLVAAPHMTVAQLLTQFILPYNLRAVPVAADGRLVGIVTLGDIKDVPQDQWGTVTVEQEMTGGEKLRTVRPQDGLDRAMELLGDGQFDQLPVVDPAGRLVGLLTRARLLRWLQIREELKLPKPTGAAS
jgi:Zn-dependent protease/predicted transcriptional regulator